MTTDRFLTSTVAILDCCHFKSHYSLFLLPSLPPVRIYSVPQQLPPLSQFSRSSSSWSWRQHLTIPQCLYSTHIDCQVLDKTQKDSLFCSLCSSLSQHVYRLFISYEIEALFLFLLYLHVWCMFACVRV